MVHFSDMAAWPGSISSTKNYALTEYIPTAPPFGIAQLFDLTGDLKWVSGHKETCEKALDYMIRRDSNDNHLVEMMTRSESEKRGSDWIDIIWYL